MSVGIGTTSAVAHLLLNILQGSGFYMLAHRAMPTVESKMTQP